MVHIPILRHLQFQVQQLTHVTIVTLEPLRIEFMKSIFLVLVPTSFQLAMGQHGIPIYI